MKKRRMKFLYFAICAALSMCLLPLKTLKANAQYEIVFKAGLHGTIHNEKSIRFPVQAGELFPDEPSVVAQEGYVFKGWNKTLPEVGSVVEGKQIYVAQYDVLVSGVNYIVRYVNEDNVEIATPKSSMAEEGSTVIERAKTIPGYAYRSAQQSFKVSNKETQFTFTYTLTNPDEVIRYEEEVINQVTPGQDANQNAGGPNNENDANNENNENNENNGNENEGNNENENVNDPDTPLAKGESKSDLTYLYIGGAAAVLAIILAGLFVRKKKQNTTDEK